MYVLVRNEDGFFVAPPGQERSYVRDLREARIFNSPQEAERERCVESETVRRVATSGGRIVLE